MIELTVSEPTAIELEVVEAAIKPEQTKTVTPTYEAQTVLPDAGTTLGQVNVEAIPDPTAIKEIDSNGDHDVRRYGTARVDVQPTLQSKTATPTEQAQTILPDTDYDGLESVNIARIPTEYIVPTGTKNITTNGTESVREYDSVNVNVPIPPEYIIPTGTKTITVNGTGINVREFERVDVNVSSTPEYGFVLEGWNEQGQPTTLRLCGFTDPPQWYFYPFASEAVNNSRGYFCNRLTTLILNEGIVRIRYYVFREMKTIQRVVFPSTIRAIQGWAFYGDNALSELDFSLATEIPTLDNPGQLTHATGCVIKVPSSLLSAWQTATNWNALTGVVWEGV